MSTSAAREASVDNSAHDKIFGSQPTCPDVPRLAQHCIASYFRIFRYVDAFFLVPTAFIATMRLKYKVKFGVHAQVSLPPPCLGQSESPQNDDDGDDDDDAHDDYDDDYYDNGDDGGDDGDDGSSAAAPPPRASAASAAAALTSLKWPDSA